MRGLSLELLLLLFEAISTAASGIVYITDLPSFSSLAPCAGDAVSYGSCFRIRFFLSQMFLEGVPIHPPFYGDKIVTLNSGLQRVILIPRS
jgi:hypothetical protein